MTPSGPSESSEGVSIPATAGPIGRVERRLHDLEGAIRSAARRSRRFSWYAWGFLFAGAAGIPLIEIAVLLASVGLGEGNQFLEVVLLATLPAWALLVLAIRELLLGRREAIRFSAGTLSTQDPPGRGLESLGVNLVTVQQGQAQVSRVRSELEVSMIPLVLGGIGGLDFFGGLAFDSVPGLPPVDVVFVPLLPVVLIIPIIWVIWRLAREWVDPYQRGLDDQVRQMVFLEGEFLGRFAAGAART